MAKINARGCRALVTVDREKHPTPEQDASVEYEREVRVLRSDLIVLRRFTYRWRRAPYGQARPTHTGYSTYLDLRPLRKNPRYHAPDRQSQAKLADDNLVAATWAAGKLLDGWEIVACEGPVAALLGRGEALARMAREEAAARKQAKEAAFRGPKQ